MAEAEHIKPLTGLRFFAAMWVVFYHYWPKLLGMGEPTGIVGKGYLGVELFFVLSGFILCHVYLGQVERGRYRYGSFLWNRLARVYPLHLATLAGIGALALAATAAGMAIDPHILSWRSLPANLLLVQAWGFAPDAGWNHPSWSISAEWFAYLSFPAFAWAALRLKDRPLLAMAGAIGAMIVLYAAFARLAGFPLTSATIAWGALRIVPCFALGCAAFLVWKSGRIVHRKMALAGAAFSGAGALILAAFGAPDGAIVPLFGMMILSLAACAETGSKLLSQKMFVYLGKISYSVYMVCVPWKLVFPNAMAKIGLATNEQLPWYLWLVFLAGVVPLAAASYHLIEHPARERMKLMAAGWKARRSARLSAQPAITGA